MRAASNQQRPSRVGKVSDHHPSPSGRSAGSGDGIDGVGGEPDHHGNHRVPDVPLSEDGSSSDAGRVLPAHRELLQALKYIILVLILVSLLVLLRARWTPSTTSS